MADEDLVTHRVILVRGNVQGVNYRASARRKGAELGIEVDPRNLDDGSVRIRVGGASDAVDAFIAWCQVGPPASRVESVHVEDVA